MSKRVSHIYAYVRDHYIIDTVLLTSNIALTQEAYT